MLRALRCSLVPVAWWALVIVHGCARPDGRPLVRLAPALAFARSARKDLVSSLAYVPDRGLFVLLIQNQTDRPVAFHRDFRCFELRLFDGSGRKISALNARLDTADFPKVELGYLIPWDWVVLRPGQGATIVLAAYTADGAMSASEIQSKARRADCVYNGYFDAVRPPDFVRRSGAVVQPFAPAPSIAVP